MFFLSHTTKIFAQVRNQGCESANRWLQVTIPMREDYERRRWKTRSEYNKLVTTGDSTGFRPVLMDWERDKFTSSKVEEEENESFFK